LGPSNDAIAAPLCVAQDPLRLMLESQLTRVTSGALFTDPVAHADADHVAMAVRTLGELREVAGLRCGLADVVAELLRNWQDANAGLAAAVRRQLEG
jgi:hypothetical protein